MKETFIRKFPRQGTLKLIKYIGELVDQYMAEGYSLTVRQVFYQLVARDMIPNEEKWYKKIVRAISDGRLLGMIDWQAIEDRTRSLRSLPHWSSPKDIMESTIGNYRIDLWENQPLRIEVWIEKDALVGVISSICQEYRVPYFSCRGYTSQSSLWRAAKRITRYNTLGQDVIILHLGDHDPSGLDMTRDMQDRLCLLTREESFEVKRIALSMGQIDKYNPPPNPTKITDTRAEEYINKYGHDCWELDSLEPKVIVDLVDKHILSHIDADAWAMAKEGEQEDINTLTEIVDGLED